MKRSSDYWQKRFQAVEAMQNQTARNTVQDIMPSFNRAEQEISKEIDAWYARFATNNQISMAEAKRLLNTRELKEFRWDVTEYIKYGRENAIDQKWMKELENASARFHISRLEALRIRTQNAAEKAFGSELDLIDDMGARLYMDGYYHTAYEIQRGLGIGFDVSKIDQRKLDRVLSKPWTADGKTFSNRVWTAKTNMVSELHNQMTRMCLLGKSPDEAIKAMEQFVDKKVKNAKSAAGRLVMTESAAFSSMAQKDCFEDLEVEFFEVVATLDNKTSDICQEMDGKHFPMSDFEVGATAPPFHVWCRSCTAPWFEDDDDGMRAARDENGQTYYVPANMKYADWKACFVDKTMNPADFLKPVVDVAALKQLLSGKEAELDSLKNKFKTISDDHVEWKKGKNNSYYQKYDSMSDSEYKKYVQDLNDRDKDLCIELDKLKDDLDRYYDRPKRGTPERDVWDKWKKDNNIDLNELNTSYYTKQNELRAIRDEFNETVGFNKWKSKFGSKTEKDFVDEITNITFEQQDIQKEIDDLKKQIDEAIKAQADAEFNAKTLAEIKDSIMKKHESILRTDVQKQELADIIDGMDKDRANLYDKMAVNFKTNQYYQKRAGWYSPARKRVEMDLDDHPWDDRLERNLHGAWKTKLHEEMHQLDHVLASRKSDFALMDGFTNKHSLRSFTHPDTVTGKKLIAAIDDDILDFINKAVDWDIATNGASIKHIKSLGRISTDAKEATIRYLKHMYPTAKDRARIDTLTDAIGLTTNGNLHPWKHGFWGHDAAYCKQSGKRGATSEAWANLGAFFIRNDTEVLDAVKAVMPKTISAYKDVFDEVMDYAKANTLTYTK